MSEGGLAVGAAEMTFSCEFGIEINLKKVLQKGLNGNSSVLFSESNSRLLIEVPQRFCSSFEQLMEGSTFARIGSVTDKKQLNIVGRGETIIDLPIGELMTSWKTPLGGLK